MADAGILFPAIPAGILFPADPAGILFPADPAGILFPADLAEPVIIGVADLADAGILFPPVPSGIPFPADPAGILFPADLAEPVTVGVADLADAGILFPAVPAGIPFPTDTAGTLFPADLAEPVTVGVADLGAAGAAPLTVPDVFTELELFTMEMAEVVGTVNGIPIYYVGDYDGLWDPECDDIGYIGNFDGQSESSDYEDPRNVYYDEWMEWCDFNSPDIMGFHRRTGRPSCLSLMYACGGCGGNDCTGTIVAGFVGYICFCGGYRPRAGNGLSGAPCYRGPTEMEDSWILDFQECPGASCDMSGDVDVAYAMGTDVWVPETVVVRSGKGVRSEVICHLGFNCQWNCVRLLVVFRPHLLGIACSRETIWDPGGVGVI